MRENDAMRRVAILILLFVTSGLHAASRWSLQSNPWVNLHQRLMYQTKFNDATDPIGLDPAQLAQWKKAVDAYRVWIAGRHPIFNRELIALNEALSRTTGDKLPDSIPKGAADVLNAAMPLYRSGQWQEDDRANRFFIAYAEPLLASAGEELAQEHAKVYGVAFPSHIHVDVTAYAWQFGAYTVGDEDHAQTVMSSIDPGYQGFSALEMLLHEPSHVIVDTTTGAIGGDLTRISRELGVKTPPNLWHAILFYTSSELTRRALAKRGVTTTFTPSMIGMYTHGFKDFRHALETHWQGYLDGKITKEAALRAILTELVQRKVQ